LLDTRTPKTWREHHSTHVRDRIDALLRQARVFDHRPGEHPKILSVGCGHNARLNIPDRPDRRRFHVTGVDTSEASLRNAARTADEVHLASATDLPFTDAAFDVVIFRFVL